MSRIIYREAKRKALALYTFLVRLYFYDDDKMQQVESLLHAGYQTTLEELHMDFYRKFELGFCVASNHRVVPNAHAFFHLLESRRRTGPLPDTSAEPFESLYAILRRCFRAGTRNTPKQIVENFYIKDT